MPQLLLPTSCLTGYIQDGHAFILRRFDTGAVSLTTMFRAAFPNASDSEEKLEVAWVKDTYDLSGNNGSTRDSHITRLAGVWVGPAVALELGYAYMLGRLIEAVVEATPDPNGNYRRSGKSAAINAPTIAPATVNAQAVVAPLPPSIVSKPSTAVKSLPTPSPTATANPPPKRRKESSPTVEPQSIVKPPSRHSPSRHSPASSKVSAPLPPSPTLRRSTRTKSPAPRQPSAPPSLRTPKATRSAVKKESTRALTPGSSDLTVVDEESLVVEDGVVGTELRDQDIEEQHKLIQDLKDKRDASRKAQLKGEEGMDVAADESSSSVHSSTTGKKREREDEDEPLKFNFKEPEMVERAISTNRRVGRFNMEPRTKSFAWGLAAFAVGMGAV
jgi:hypothetical protein